MKRILLALVVLLCASSASAQSSYRFAPTRVAWMRTAPSLTAPAQPVYPPSMNVFQSTGVENQCPDILQLWGPHDPEPNGPQVRFNCDGHMFTHRLIQISGSSISGCVPQGCASPTMFAVQSDLGDGVPTAIFEANISADMRQPIEYRGNGVVRWSVDSWGKGIFHGQDAHLEVTKTGGSGPLVNTFQGQPTTTGTNQPIVVEQFKSNTGDVVATSEVISRADNSGASWLFRTKQPSGLLYPAFQVDNASAWFVFMSGGPSGKRFVCVDSAGTISASLTPCR